LKVCWVTPWDRKCGIADYSKNLWPAVSSRLEQKKQEGFVLSLDTYDSGTEILKQIKMFRPDIVHFQHEYGLFGGKNPPFYSYPRLIKYLKRNLSGVKLFATAHTVLPPDYKYQVKGKKLYERPIRSILNFAFLPFLKKTWGKKTWGELDAVVVHSKLQKSVVEMCGTKLVVEIPHFVPWSNDFEIKFRKVLPIDYINIWKKTNNIKFVLMVFGFFTPEKGQDVAIRALCELPSDVGLVLAGGVRRRGDEKYHSDCVDLIKMLGLGDRVMLPGFIKNNDIDSYFAAIDFVIAPFRETSGSGSLVHGIARGATIFASDLPINLEIINRVPDALVLFRSEDYKDLADKIMAYYSKPELLNSLKTGATEYARVYSVGAIAQEHVELYNKLI